MDFQNFEYKAAGLNTWQYRAEGFIGKVTVGVDVVPGKALYFDEASKTFKLALADNNGTIPATCLALEPVAAGGLCHVLFFGLFETQDEDGAHGKLYVSASNAGDMTDTAPGTPAYVNHVGIGFGSQLLFAPGMAVPVVGA
jgi:hypothetical protein